MRRPSIFLHRCAGLFLAGFLALAGLTGSVIAFHHELDRLLNPGVFSLKPVEERLSAEAWIAAAEAAYPNGQVTYLIVPQTDEEPVTLFLSPRLDSATQKSAVLPGNIDQVFLHPATGDILGARDRDGFRLDRLHMIPFIYTLHYSLHLGQWGIWLLGVVALIWFFDCFIGLYLALPRLRWKALKQAFSVNCRAGRARVHYDLHRAGGLWLWIVLLVLAFSAVSLNLHDEVFDPVVNAVAPMTPWPGDAVANREDSSAPLPLPVSKAIAEADRGLRQAGLRGNLGAVWINQLKGFYHLGYHTDADIMRAHPGTWVSIQDGKKLAVDVRPAGGHTIGDAIHDWQFPLHSGKAFGLGGRILISITGIAVAMLSITGVAIWWKKRKGRLQKRSRIA